ncbi:MAG: NAD(P)H-dependent oxidoreductase [Chloroflexota bacterium]
MKIHVIVGSTRQNRISEKPAQWIYEYAKTKPDLDVELIDLRDYPLPLFDGPTAPMHLQGKYSDELVQKWSNKVAEADGYIIVSPEYNHGYPAVLKNAIDVIYPEWNNKPVGFVSYGTLGGARAVEQLRLVAIELQMIPIQRALPVPGPILMALMRPQDGNTSNPFEAITWQADGFLDQLIWWTKALKVAREQQEPIKPLMPPALSVAPR